LLCPFAANRGQLGGARRVRDALAGKPVQDAWSAGFDRLFFCE
jgi:hypothetical protein